MKHSRMVVIISVLFLIFSSLFLPLETQSANLTTVRDQLQTSRISFAGRVKSPTVAGSTHVWIYTTGTSEFYSVSTAGLKVGDSITIGSNTYAVATIVDADEFTTTANLAVGDADDTDVIYFKSRPRHVVTFNTVTAVPNGFFRVLLPAASTNNNDGIPDSTGFDFNTTVDVTAVDAAGFTFSNNSATASGVGACTSLTNFHCFEYHYSGAGTAGTAITLYIGNTDGSDTPIAPAPKSTHTQATADTYSVRVQQFASGANPASATPTDQTVTKIGVIESVRITATVDPSISFTIAGVVSGANPCGTGTVNQTDIDTTTGTNAPLAVPFGTLTFSSFKDAAHLLTVSTNAVNGYAVTAIENDQLGKDGSTSPFIVDADGDNGLATETVSDTWDTASGNPGFGYTLKTATGAAVPFESTTAVFNVRRFPATADSESAASIMSSTGVAASHQINVCYRITVDSSQTAGNYQNTVTYTATASF